MTVSDQDRIRSRAFEIWQAEGCPEGRDVEHWLKAEEEVSSNGRHAAAEPAPAPAPVKAPRKPAVRKAAAPKTATVTAASVERKPAVEKKQAAGKKPAAGRRVKTADKV
ncbi:MAG: DUF2934 domain-containing protein [Telmatospirillum sp.]|nr:DUF2934 domain-containing protein [Telmatospirillum sp.]